MEGKNQNFLLEVQQNKKKSRNKAWSAVLVLPFRIFPVFLLWVLILSVLALLVLGVAALPYLESFKFIVNEALSGKENLQTAQGFFEQQRFAQAKVALDQSNRSFSHAEEELKELAVKPLFKLPYFKKQVEIADGILFIGRNLSQSLSEIAGFGSDVLGITKQNSLDLSSISEEQRALVLQRLVELGPQLEATKVAIEQTRIVWENISLRSQWSFWNPIIKPIQEKMPDIFKGFDYLIIASETLPDLVGYPDEKTYLFLMLNNNEIRPGGGFIGTYGIIKVRNGDLVSFFTDNIYNLDSQAKDRLHIEPPKPIQQYLRQKQWFMRDANWWPDFPTSAKKVEEFYHWEAAPGEEIDGVIAINPDFVVDLLKLVGSIQVADINFTTDNFIQELQYQVEFGYYKQGIAEADRKNIIGDLSQELQNRIYALPVEQWQTLLDIVRENLVRKHIFTYFDNPRLQDFVAEKQWSGEVTLTSDDYLQVVDANLAALKTDAVMERSYKYQIEPEQGGMKAKAELTYKNTGTFTEFTTRYRSYTRIYVPLGSELKSVRVGNQAIEINQVDQTEEFDKTVFGLFFEVEPKQSKTIIFEYSLPSRVVASMQDGDYKLLLQKQLGIREFDLNLDLSFPETVKVFGGREKTNQIKAYDKIFSDQLYTVLFE